jgi:hypothetical protein
MCDRPIVEVSSFSIVLLWWEWMVITSGEDAAFEMWRFRPAFPAKFLIQII